MCCHRGRKRYRNGFRGQTRPISPGLIFWQTFSQRRAPVPAQRSPAQRADPPNCCHAPPAAERAKVGDRAAWADRAPRACGPRAQPARNPDFAVGRAPHPRMAGHGKAVAAFRGGGPIGGRGLRARACATQAQTLCKSKRVRPWRLAPRIHATVTTLQLGAYIRTHAMDMTHTCHIYANTCSRSTRGSASRARRRSLGARPSKHAAAKTSSCADAWAWHLPPSHCLVRRES